MTTTRNVTVTETAGQKRVFNFDIELDGDSPGEFVAAAVRKAFHDVRPTGFYPDSAFPVTNWDGCTVFHGVAVRSCREGDKVVSTSLRVDVENIKSDCIGKTLTQIDDLGVDWDGFYPAMEMRGELLVCVGIVNGNYPNEFNDGKWHIVDDRYVMADEPSDDSVLARNGINLERDTESSGFVSTMAVTRDVAVQIVGELRDTGVDADWSPDNDDPSIAWIYVTPETAESIEIDGIVIHVEPSGKPATEDTCPANIQAEIAAEILDGGRETCADYAASNGMRYSW